jgi:GDP-L-fucose synthase
MRAFITGGSGFLGRHLIENFRQSGFDYYAPNRNECDLTKSGSLDKIDLNFTHIFHLSAHTQAGDWCLTHQGEQWLINQKINTNLLSWWHENQPSAKLISIGTSCSYSPGIQMTENNYFAGEPIESLFTYAMTKRMLLQGQRALNQQYGLKYLHVIPSTLYGPSYHLDGRQMHFVFDLIRKILRGKYLNEQVELWGNGLQRRELVHVDDFISNLLTLVEKDAVGEYNLGAGADYSIKEFAELISEILNYDPKFIKYDETKYVGAKTKLLDTDKARNQLENYANRPLEAGLRDTIKWFEETKAFF